MPAPTEEAALDPDLGCLITGAGGAVARKLAVWLAARGVRHLALVGRGEADMELLAELAAQGAQPRFYQADVADCARMAAVLEQIQRDQAPLGGVFHLAGVLDDGMLGGQTWPRWESVLRPKVSGAWNLHQLTLASGLRFFVSFSSVASLLGTAGQSSYAAANAFLDALACHRRALGLSGLSINWGPWGEIGMAARLDPEQWARMEAQGVFGLETQAALDMLGRLMAAPATASPRMAVLALDWPSYAARHAQSGQWPFLARLVQVAAPDGDSLRQRLQRLPPAERRNLLIRVLSDLVAEVLRLPRDEVAPRERLFDLGIDSLIAIELKNRLQGILGLGLSTTLLFDYPTIETLAQYLLETLTPVLSAVADGVSAPGSASAAAIPAVRELSEEEAEAMLLAQLEQLEGGPR